MPLPRCSRDFVALHALEDLQRALPAPRGAARGEHGLVGVHGQLEVELPRAREEVQRRGPAGDASGAMDITPSDFYRADALQQR